MHQSALVIVVPEAEARFGELRRRFDPQAALGVPAHVTLLFPFVAPERVDDDVRRKLSRLFKRHSPFRCVFDQVAVFAATAYLQPRAGAPFVELTAALGREFPDHPPYGGAHAGVVPHLTIADGDASCVPAVAARLRAELERNGPVVTQCASVTLLENSSGRWKHLLEFPLVGHQG